MRKLFDYANEYVRTSDWKEIALLKFCLCAMGIMIGVNLAPKHKKAVTAAAAVVFAVTYVPLMSRFLRVIADGNKKEK